jgi:hypothetical protein
VEDEQLAGMMAAISMVRDEADIIGWSIDHLLAEGIGLVIVADNLSTDETRAILETRPVHIVDDPEPGFYQSRKMTQLARLAAELGAEWIIPFDADELWHSTAGRIADVLQQIDVDVLEAELLDHLPDVSDAVDEPNPWRRSAWRRAQPQPQPKVAFRADPEAILAMGNHGVVRRGERARGILTVRHLQFRSPQQLVRKVRQGAAAYQRTDLPETFGAHWRQLARETDEQLQARWLSLLSEPRVFDPAPFRSFSGVT